MYKKNIFGLKAVSASVFVSMIILISTTTAPMINGSKTTDLLENKNNNLSIVEKNRYREGADLYNKENINLETIVISLSIYLEILNYYIENVKPNEIECKRILNEKIFPSMNKIYSNLYTEEQMNDILLTQKNVANDLIAQMKFSQDIDGKFDEASLSYPISDYFQEYWAYYVKIVKYWKILEAETMFDFDNINNVIWRLVKIINVILVITSGAYAATSGSLLLPWLLMTVLVGMDLGYLFYFFQVYSLWLELIGRSITLVVHVTNQNGTGINGLENHLMAYNIEAYQEIDKNPALTGHKKYFTYPLDSDSGYTGPGWYSTSSWWHVYLPNETIWHKPPCPPGYWDISIKGAEGYNDFNNQTEDINKHKTSVIEITLFSNPNTPTIVSPADHTILNVEEICDFTVFAIDPNNGQVRYQFDWDAYGIHNYSNWSDWVNSGNQVIMQHSWDTPGNYTVEARTDDNSAKSPWSKGLTIHVIEKN